MSGALSVQQAPQHVRMQLADRDTSPSPTPNRGPHVTHDSTSSAGACTSGITLARHGFVPRINCSSEPSTPSCSYNDSRPARSTPSPDKQPAARLRSSARASSKTESLEASPKCAYASASSIPPNANELSTSPHASRCQPHSSPRCSVQRRPNLAEASATASPAGSSPPKRVARSTLQTSSPPPAAAAAAGSSAASHRERRRLEVYAINAVLAAHEEFQARAALAKLQAAEPGGGAGGAPGQGAEQAAASRGSAAAREAHGV